MLSKSGVVTLQQLDENQLNFQKSLNPGADENLGTRAIGVERLIQPLRITGHLNRIIGR